MMIPLLRNPIPSQFSTISKHIIVALFEMLNNHAHIIYLFFLDFLIFQTNTIEFILTALTNSNAL